MPAIPTTISLNKSTMNKDQFHTWMLDLHAYLTGVIASTGTAEDARAQLGLGTAATKNTGFASGNVIPAAPIDTWQTVGAISNVAGLLAWKNFGNGHVIFDASQAISPTGSAVNQTNPIRRWIPTYPTLMGWNGTDTYGVRVDSSREADTLSTATGAAPAYACRAWVNFNGTGTVAIRAAGNVGSITDNGVGDYTVNFTTAMPGSNYGFSGMSTGLSTQPGGNVGIVSRRVDVEPTAAALRVLCGQSGTGAATPADSDTVCVSVFG